MKNNYHQTFVAVVRLMAYIHVKLIVIYLDYIQDMLKKSKR